MTFGLLAILLMVPKIIADEGLQCEGVEICQKCDSNCAHSYRRFKCENYCNCSKGTSTLSQQGKLCSTNCTNNDCHIECIDGYHGKGCDLECNSGCKDGLCERKDGRCLSCVNGLYGETCLRECTSSCRHNICDQIDGNCTFGCQDGFFGLNCNKTCESCFVCHPVDGRCLIDDQPRDNCLIVLSILGSIIGLTVSSISIFLIYRCCKRNRATTENQGTTDPVENSPPVKQIHTSVVQANDPHYEIIRDRLPSQKSMSKSLSTLTENDSFSMQMGLFEGYKQVKKNFRKKTKSAPPFNEQLPSHWVGGGQGIFELFNITTADPITEESSEDKQPRESSTEEDVFLPCEGQGATPFPKLEIFGGDKTDGVSMSGTTEAQKGYISAVYEQPE